MLAYRAGAFTGAIGGSNTLSLGNVEFNLILGRLAMRTLDGTNITIYCTAADDPLLLGGTFAGTQLITGGSPQIILGGVQRNKITAGGGMMIQIVTSIGRWYFIHLAITSTSATPNGNIFIQYTE